MADDKPANPEATTLEDAHEHGYVGQPPDPQPNEAYTVEGSVKAAEEAAKETGGAEPDTSKSKTGKRS